MIRIALLFTLASLTGLHAPAIIVSDGMNGRQSVTDEVIEKEVSELTQDSKNHLGTEEVVKDYFKDTPILVAVAQCESNFRHTDEDGEILRGVANYYDIGVMQINERFHLDEANKLGLDIYSIAGNLEYARYLYENEGVIPWDASSSCWMDQS
jgi:hypothetical protein